MAPSLKCLYPGDDNKTATRSQQPARPSSAAADYSCPYDSEDWSATATSQHRPGGDLVEEESKSRTSFTITIPLPWPKKFLKRSSSVPGNSRNRGTASSSADLHITSPILSAAAAAGPSPEQRPAISTTASSGGSKQVIAGPSSSRALPPLSPVNEGPANEGFASPDSVDTTSDPSPVTPINQDDQEDIATTTLFTILDPPANQPGGAAPGRYEGQFSRSSSLPRRNEPAPGLAATAFMRSAVAPAPPGYQWELRARSPSGPTAARGGSPALPSRRVPSMESLARRPRSRATTITTTTTTTTTDDGSDQRHSHSSWGSWQQIQRASRASEAGSMQSGPRSAASNQSCGPAMQTAVWSSAAPSPTIATARSAPPDTTTAVCSGLGRRPQQQHHHHHHHHHHQQGQAGQAAADADDTEGEGSPLHTLVPSGQELWG